MQGFSDVYTDDNFITAFQAAITKLDNFISKAGAVAVVHNAVSDSLKFSFFSWAEGQSEFEKTIYRIIFDYCSRADKLGPGSFRLCLETIIDLIKNFQGPAEHLVDFRSKIFSTLFAGARHPDVEEVKWLIREAAGDETVFQLLWSAVELSGIEGKISVEKTSSKTPSVELVNGYNFEIKCAFDTPPWKQKNAKILIIDGVIDSVAECDRILSAFSESKEPLVFVARGFHEEVILTLKTNFNRRTLNVMPFSVPFDALGVNTLKDLAVVSNTDIISSLKGQLITCVKFEDIVKIDEIAYKDGVLTILHQGSQLAVSQHSKMLIEQKAKVEIEAAAELYDKRIKSMTPSYAILRLPEKYMASEKMEIALHTFRAAVSFGLVDTRKLLFECMKVAPYTGFNVRRIFEELTKKEKLPANFILGVFKYSIDCYKVLKSVGAVISP